MTTMKTLLLATLCLAGASTRVLADDYDVDVRTAEYLDVIQTTDGSIWKGVVVEQTPGSEYKIATADGSLHVIKAADVVKLTKQRNKDYRATMPVGAPAGFVGGDRADGISRSASPSQGLPAPTAHTGVRAEADLAFVFPAGDIANGTNTTFSPSVSVGYEAMFGNLGLSGGGLARFDYWQLPGNSNDAAWLFETHAYGRAALHISRVALFGGVSLGIDTNYVYSAAADMSKTTLGFGMNLQTGIEVAAAPNLAVKLGFDYHPGTDKIVDNRDVSASYYALLVGAGLRL